MLRRAKEKPMFRNFGSLGVLQKRPTILPHVKPREDAQLEFIVAAVYLSRL